MASFGRSFKPSAYLSLGRRPPIGRTMSNSSDHQSSGIPSPDMSDHDTVFSTRASPSLPDTGRPGSPPHSGEAYFISNTSNLNHPPAISQPSATGHDASSQLIEPSSPASRSRPIAIELPAATKKTAGAPAYTPPAPLSARGDVLGGYFPLHEDQGRIYRPHPFHLDVTKARHKSISRASQSSSPEASNHIPPTGGLSERASAAGLVTAPAAMQDHSRHLPVPNGPKTSSRPASNAGNKPVAAYLPSGVHDSPLPMGKYYPSNYEQRKEEKRERKRREQLESQPVRPAPPAGTSVKSDTEVPIMKKEASKYGHARNESEAKRRLQQYQRDMIAQATLALHGGNVGTTIMSSLNVHKLGFTSFPSNPSKPVLAPLGSPGPVTPMELEGSDQGYLGGPMESSREAEEIARAIRADEERRRREDTTSPVVELSRNAFF